MIFRHFGLVRDDFLVRVGYGVDVVTTMMQKRSDRDEVEVGGEMR